MNVPQMQQNLEHAQMQETILKAQLEVSTLSIQYNKSQSMFVYSLVLKSI